MLTIKAVELVVVNLKVKGCIGGGEIGWTLSLVRSKIVVGVSRFDVDGISQRLCKRLLSH